MSRYTKLINSKGVIQKLPLLGREAEMAKNNAGGFVFKLDKWKHLERFLILGSEGNTYYVKEQDYTNQALTAVRACIAEDGVKAVKEALRVSHEGLAHKNDPALVVHALASVIGDNATRTIAFDTLHLIARTGTHLFNWLGFRKAFKGGWGSGPKRAIADWYTSKSPEALAYQLMKYKNRNGWTHRDVLRLTHIKPDNEALQELFEHVVKGGKFQGAQEELVKYAAADMLTPDIAPAAAVHLITKYQLPREVIPTELLNSVEIWEALLENMPLTAMIRNLGKMTSIGLIAPMSDAAKKVINALGDTTALAKARVHPMTVLLALNTYKAGRGVKGGLTWNAVQPVVDSLDDAFYASFKNVTPTNKRLVLALDCSASMSARINNTHLSCLEAAAAMALVTARTESDYTILGFSTTCAPLPISPKQRLTDAVDTMRRFNWGGTDTAQPILWATSRGIKVDGFISYTDNETWAGEQHTSSALEAYRNKTKVNAKSVVVGMTATEFSIADPKDPLSLDVVGFDASAPDVIGQFLRE